MRFLLTPLREGRRLTLEQLEMRVHISTHAPAGGATSGAGANGIARSHFYSRPCGRGDIKKQPGTVLKSKFLLTPLREGRQVQQGIRFRPVAFLLTPLREGRQKAKGACYMAETNFYSRPCGRGDARPLQRPAASSDFYSRPCGRGDTAALYTKPGSGKFLLTPLREGRPSCSIPTMIGLSDFYSRPCGRGD